MKKRDIIDLIPLFIALALGIFWVCTGFYVRENPYLLGLFRGIIYTILILFWFNKLR